MVNTHSTNGNGAHPDAAEQLPPFLWDGLAPAVVRALEAPLDPALVSHRKGRGNKTFPYLEGHTVIDEANAIFGFGGWGYELLGDVVLREFEQADAKTGEIRRFRAYTAVVRASVPGAQPRTDVGYHAVAEETADGHETAVKGAVTDGLKRALRSFGQRFGNGLAGEPPAAPAPAAPPAKQEPASPAPQGAPSAGPVDEVPALREQLLALGAAQGFDAAQVAAAVKGKTGKTFEELDAAGLRALVEAAERKARENGTAQEGAKA